MRGDCVKRALERTAGRLRALSGALKDAAARSVCAAAEAAAREARAHAPMDSGALRAGISARREGETEAAVLSTAPHAAMVEFGTSRMAAQPHLLPAAGAVRAAFFASAREEAQRAAKEVWK